MPPSARGEGWGPEWQRRAITAVHVPGLVCSWSAQCAAGLPQGPLAPACGPPGPVFRPRQPQEAGLVLGAGTEAALGPGLLS